MLYFECDYNNGAAPKVLDRLVSSNSIFASGYGDDEFTRSAKEKIRKTIGKVDAEIEFVYGGTQANQLVISSLLSSFEGVISCETGHVNTHEAGAIEYSGHKVITIKERDGKIDKDDLALYLESFHSDGNRDAMVYPKMVYISHPTEKGTLYSKKELNDIKEVCSKYGLYLFLDGARLSYGLEAKNTDVTLPLISELCDAFYIGGTKCGALCGEAIVYKKEIYPSHFQSIKKMHGALAAKGRLFALQFDALFTDNYYFDLGRNAIEKAEGLKEILKNKGYTFYFDSPTNQQFVVVENERMKKLSKSVKFGFWEKVDEKHTAIRLCTSWSTTTEDLEELEKVL